MTKKHLQNAYFNNHEYYLKDMGIYTIGSQYNNTTHFAEKKNSYLDPAISKKGKEVVDSEALHPDFISELAKVSDVSVQKGYEPFNWLKKGSPTKVSTLLKAAARHINKGKKGIDDNKEIKLDGTPINIKAHHFTYAAYNLLMAAKIIQDLPENDDRLFKDGKLR